MNTGYAVDRKRWSEMNILDQMGNIYSEIGRTFKALHGDDQERYDQALARAIDLFDATAMALVKQQSPKLKEVLRAKEEFLRVCESKNSISERSLDNYFMQFAVAARLSREYGFLSANHQLRREPCENISLSQNSAQG